MNFLIHVENGIGLLRLNRPTVRNALDVATLRDLERLLQQLSDDNNLRCLVISGEGKSFCSGADVDEWAHAEAAGVLASYGWTEAAHALISRVYHFPKPTIAMLNGSAVGGGLDLALACDFRYAASHAKLLAGYTAMAYSPDGGSSYFLPRLIGEAQAKAFLMLDEPCTAELALNLGLVHGVVNAEQLAATVMAIATRLAQGPTFAYGRIKSLLAASLKNDLTAQLHAEKNAALACGDSVDGQEALNAFKEKRDAQFCGH